MKLPENWQKVVEKNSEYIVQLCSWWKWLLFLLKNLNELLGQRNNAIIVSILHMRKLRGKYF